MHESITSERVIEVCELAEFSLDNPGICVSCGEDAQGCEPDAAKYECEACGGPFVYGTEALLLMMSA